MEAGVNMDPVCQIPGYVTYRIKGESIPNAPLPLRATIGCQHNSLIPAISSPLKRTSDCQHEVTT